MKDAALTDQIVARRRRRRRIALIVTSAVLVVVAACAVYAGLYIRALGKNLKADDKTATAAAKSLTKAEPNKPFTILLLGADGKGASGDSRSDTIILGKVDPARKKIWLVSIPRDTKAEIPGYGTAKINKAYQLGGIPLIIDTVEALTGIPVNHYAEVNIVGFRSVVDSFGGVWINVDTQIDDTKAAAANYKQAGAHIDPGYQLLDGNQALVYVRSRNFVDADFTRMRHQQQFFKALAHQAFSGLNILKLPKTVQTMAQHITTDMSVSQIVSVVLDLRSLPDKSMETATMRGDWHSPYVYTDEEYKKYILTRMKAGVSFEQTATPAGVILPPDVSVDVRNGAGIAGAASQASTLLKAADFDVRAVTNAKKSDYQQTLVVYTGKDDAEAKLVASTLGIGVLRASDGTWSMNTSVLVVIGRDWPSRTTTSR